MKIKVIETYTPRIDLKGKPVEVRHAFPTLGVPEWTTLVSSQPDGTVGDDELKYARERAKFHVIDSLVFEVEVKATPAASGAKP
jgi:hypothetical protein